MISPRLANDISTIGFLMIAAAMVVPFIQGPYNTDNWYYYLYAAGAFVMLVCALLSPYKGHDMKIKRLVRVQSWSAIIFCAGAALLFIPGTTLRDWIAFTLAGAVLRAFSTIAIAMHMRKQK